MSVKITVDGKKAKNGADGGKITGSDVGLPGAGGSVTGVSQKE